ncbi:MAG TPA: hypothetical protein VK846_07165 [Candidatus Limnocylindria bacterium]|nr:hypothetical protein [Candidatus Limnocylindria bacterium]
MEENGKHEGDAIRSHTPEDVQERIDSTLEERIRFYAAQPREAIDRRLGELDQECDLDRMLTINAASIALGGVGLSFFGGGRKWLLLSGAALTFLVMHSVQGWCPPAAYLRRRGVRTRGEIDTERYALKLLRGDFESLHAEETHGKQYPAENVWSAVRS